MTPQAQNEESALYIAELWQDNASYFTFSFNKYYQNVTVCAKSTYLVLEFLSLFHLAVR